MSDPADSAAPAPRTPGRQLAAVRVARGLTVTEIALRLKFSPKQIEALETDRYEALAGPAFVRGMVRAYAKLVGADADALVAQLRASPLTAAGPTVTGPRGMGVTIPRQTRRGSLVYVVLSVLVVVAVGGVLVEWLLRPTEPPRVAAARPTARLPLSRARWSLRSSHRRRIPPGRRRRRSPPRRRRRDPWRPC
jgi:cytoskeleton protein RodZ